jgi:hypothetical protein
VQHREHRTSALSPARHTPHYHRNYPQQAPGRDPAWCRARRRHEPTKPERDPARDLIGEEKISESTWWRRKRAVRQPFDPRWRRRRSPETAGIAGRWRVRLGFGRELGRERERGVVLTVWVGLTDPTGRLGFWPAQVGWVGTSGLWPKAYF